MGRRTINTTKGGKFMNPTDQARKEARRRELKKNKRQRQAVRQAVIRTKDPQTMIKDLEELDEMELNPVAPSPYNDKVIREKRRKLLESLIRTVDFYCKEDPSRGREFKMMIEEYKDKRLQKESFSESVKNAQTVDIEAIPLPEMPFEAPDLSDIPLPGSMPQSILKKPPGPPAGLPPPSSQLAPGHPPGLPPSKKVFISRDSPEFAKLVASERYGEAQEDSRKKEEEERGGDLTDDDEEEFHHRDDDIADDFGSEEDDEEMMSRRRGVHFADDDDDDDDDGDDGKPSDVTPLQAMMLKLAGQKVPKKPSAAADEEPSTSSSKRRHLEPPGPPPGLPPGPPPGMPPMMKTGMLPPGPPPGLPPGPPPGMPGSSLSVKQVQDQLSKSNNNNPNVFSAPPSLIPRSTSEAAPMMAGDEGVAGSSSKSSGATISAKPQLTTVPRGEATRFMPTSLRVRREVKQQPRSAMMNRLHHADDLARQQQLQDKKANEKPSADAAYDTFMKEMKGLL